MVRNKLHVINCYKRIIIFIFSGETTSYNREVLIVCAGLLTIPHNCRYG